MISIRLSGILWPLGHSSETDTSARRETCLRRSPNLLRRHDLRERPLKFLARLVTANRSSKFLEPLDLGLLSLWFCVGFWLCLCPWALDHDASTLQLIVR